MPALWSATDKVGLQPPLYCLGDWQLVRVYPGRGMVGSGGDSDGDDVMTVVMQW